MKVVQISTYDKWGGAPRAAFRLHTGLKQIGLDSAMFVRWRTGDNPAVIEYAPSKRLLHRLQRRVRRTQINHTINRYASSVPAGFELFSSHRTEYGDDLVTQLPQGEIVNLHWITDFVDWHTSLSRLCNRGPVVWTQHDMNIMTGGCHYDADCRRFRSGCGACPQLGSHDQFDLAAKLWREKQAILERIPSHLLHLVTPSRWLAAEVAGCEWLARFHCTVIPYGLSVDDFAPRELTLARQTLGIPMDAVVVLFLAGSVSNQRKGFDCLTNALLLLQDIPELFLLSVGGSALRLESNFKHLHLETINSDRLLSLVYSAADLFVIPSLQDNLPNTVLEAMACGTPVVGFDVGGIRDMVRPGLTGQLAPRGDIVALSAAIRSIVRDPAKQREMAVNCRRIAVQEYGLEVQAQRYAELYRSAIAGFSGNLSSR